MFTLNPQGLSFLSHFGAAPADAIEERHGRFFIKMGFCGFNTRANNGSGYASRAAAEAAIRKHQRGA